MFYEPDVLVEINILMQGQLIVTLGLFRAQMSRKTVIFSNKTLLFTSHSPKLKILIYSVMQMKTKSMK